MRKGHVLVADDDVGLTEQLRSLLEREQHHVVTVHDGDNAVAELHGAHFDVLVIDLKLPRRNTRDVLKALQHLSPDTEVIVVAAAADVETAMSFIRGGAFDFLPKPLSDVALAHAVRRALEHQRLKTATDLHRASQAILASSDPSALPAIIVDVSAQLLEADVVMLALADETGRMVPGHVVSSHPEARASTERELDEALLNAIARTGEPLLLPDDLDRAAFPHRMLERVRSAIVYPLVARDRHIGTLTFARVNDPRPFRSADLERASVVAVNAVLAAENATLLKCAVENARLASIGQLSAGISHEINNPLTYVLGSAEFARDEIAALLGGTSPVTDGLRGALESIGACLDDIHHGAARIAEIAADLRTMSRGEGVRREQVDLNEAIRSALRITAARTRNTATIETEFAADASVMGQAGRLSQVFANLVVNAAQAADGGAVTIRIATHREAGAVVATVTDTGPGIPDELLEEIFRPYFTTKSAASGTGLGLSLTRDIVTEHGGTIVARSRAGSGATFEVRFPASPRRDSMAA